MRNRQTDRQNKQQTERRTSRPTDEQPDKHATDSVISQQVFANCNNGSAPVAEALEFLAIGTVLGSGSTAQSCGHSLRSD